MHELDFARRPQPGGGFRIQRRGPFPDVRRALLTYWAVESLRSEGLSLRAAYKALYEQTKAGVDRKAPRHQVRHIEKSSIPYFWRRGRDCDRALRACWGDLYETLVAETREETLHTDR